MEAPAARARGQPRWRTRLILLILALCMIALDKVSERGFLSLSVSRLSLSLPTRLSVSFSLFLSLSLSRSLARSLFARARFSRAGLAGRKGAGTKKRELVKTRCMRCVHAC